MPHCTTALSSPALAPLSLAPGSLSGATDPPWNSDAGGIRTSERRTGGPPLVCDRTPAGACAPPGSVAWTHSAKPRHEINIQIYESKQATVFCTIFMALFL